MSLVDTPDVVVMPEESRPPLRERLRKRMSGYPRQVWILFAAVLAIWAGRGMVIPFLIIYFSQIVGIQASIVGAVVAGAGIAGVAFVFVVAGQIDKFGGRPVLLVTLAVISFSTFLGAWAQSTAMFLLVSLLLFVASQSYWPSIDTVVASITDVDRVIPAMSLIRVGLAVGTGLGGLFGGLLVTGGGLPEYRVLFMTSAALVAVGAVIIWRAIPTHKASNLDENGNQGSWGDVMSDRTFMYGMLILFMLVLGFTQMNMAVPAFLRAEAGITEGVIGALFFMNTVIIVLTQVSIAARVDRGNVGRQLALAAVIWMGAFLVMMATPGFAGAAVVVFLGFTAGQLIFMPLTAIFAVRLAPIHLRGRYFSLLSITWGSSWAIATLSAGIALDLPRPILLWPVMAGLMVAAAVGAYRLRDNERLFPKAKASAPPPESETIPDPVPEAGLVN
jgi:MFS family permease